MEPSHCLCMPASPLFWDKLHCMGLQRAEVALLAMPTLLGVPCFVQ